MEHADLNIAVRDTITGFTGTVTGRAEYLYEGSMLRVTRANKDGLPEHVWLPEGRCEAVKASSPVSTGFKP